jgi:hypothetical protein
MKFNLMTLDDGRFFSIKFIKADGSVRKMLARRGVKRDLKGNPRYKPDDHNIFIVWSVNDKAYRSIRVDRVFEIKANGVTYSKLGTYA